MSTGVVLDIDIVNSPFLEQSPLGDLSDGGSDIFRFRILLRFKGGVVVGVPTCLGRVRIKLLKGQNPNWINGFRPGVPLGVSPPFE
jgi:hypothetical protein